MANNQSTNQSGSESSHTNARDTNGERPAGEKSMVNHNKSKQGPEDDHHAPKSKEELADERGGHGHSGHSGSRNGSRKRQ